MSRLASLLKRHHRVEGQKVRRLLSQYPSYLVLLRRLRRRRVCVWSLWQHIVRSCTDCSVRDVDQALHIRRTVTILGAEWLRKVFGWGHQGRLDIKGKLTSRVLINMAHICGGRAVHCVEWWLRETKAVIVPVIDRRR